MFDNKLPENFVCNDCFRFKICSRHHVLDPLSTLCLSTPSKFITFFHEKIVTTTTAPIVPAKKKEPLDVYRKGALKLQKSTENGGLNHSCWCNYQPTRPGDTFCNCGITDILFALFLDKNCPNSVSNQSMTNYTSREFLQKINSEQQTIRLHQLLNIAAECLNNECENDASVISNIAADIYCALTGKEITIKQM